MKHVFSEKPESLSEFLRFEQPLDVLASQSAEQPDSPLLTYLRLECNRPRNGMNDFIIRVATPKVEGGNTIVSLRGGRSLAKADGGKRLAELIASEMKRRDDRTFNWSGINIPHLAKMLMVPIKVFASNTNMSLINFTTEALV